MKKIIYIISIILFLNINLFSSNFNTKEVGINLNQNSEEYILTDKKDKEMKNLIQAQYGDRPDLDTTKYVENGNSWNWGKMFSGFRIIGDMIIRGIL